MIDGTKMHFGAWGCVEDYEIVEVDNIGRPQTLDAMGLDKNDMWQVHGCEVT